MALILNNKIVSAPTDLLTRKTTMRPTEETTSSTPNELARRAPHIPNVALSPSLRERLTEAAYPLFASRGIRDVSLEEIERSAGVATEERATVYESREEIAADFLALHERNWSIGYIEAGARERGSTPEERLLAIFDMLDDWFSGEQFAACSFITVLFELGAQHPLGQACVEYLLHARQMVSTLAQEAQLRDTDEFARSFHILMKGSIVSATEGDVHAARRSQRMARTLIREHARDQEAEHGVPTPDDASEAAGNETVAEWTEWDDLLGWPGVTSPDAVPVAARSAGAAVAFDYEYDFG